MTALKALIRRNMKLFFKDKGMFFTSLITPIILLVLYITFLGDVYRDAIETAIPQGVSVAQSTVDGCVGGWLISSLLAVCCVTVAFCANMLMVQDKVSGARKDLTLTPVHSSTLALGYYLSSFFSTLLICLIATAAGFGYLAAVGWYLSAGDALLVVLDVVLLVLFGTALSSLINCFLSSQGQISAVGTVVSAGYGFICGAYMPISQFSEGLQTVLSFLPGTYGTALLRTHTLQGVFESMTEDGVPAPVIQGLRGMVDCQVTFFDHTVSNGAMFAVLGGSVALLIAAFVLVHFLRRKSK